MTGGGGGPNGGHDGRGPLDDTGRPSLVEPQPRWLEGASAPGSLALRRALDDAAGAHRQATQGEREGREDEQSQQAFARQRVWARVQAPWWAGRGARALPPVRGASRGWFGAFLIGAGVMAAAAVALVVATGGWNQLAPHSTPLATAPVPTSGLPQVAPLHAGQPTTGALTTGPGERVRHRLARGVDAELAPRTALVPGDDQAAPEVRVGRVRFTVPHQAPGQRYAVRAGAYEVVVLGTVFDVAVEADGVGVNVTSGSVEVRDAGQGGSARPLARLLPGQRWSSETPERVEAMVPEPAATRGGGDVRPEASRRPGAPRPVARKPAGRRLALVDRAAEQSLDQAGELRRRDPRRALAAYQRMLAAGGAMAEVAHYEIGVIEDQDLRDPRRAVATWERYRQRYPGGLLRAEADLSVIDALSRLGEQGRALHEARDFLARRPASERRSEVARVAGDLARQAGDCKTALGLYDLTLSSRPSTDDADDASFHRASCQLNQRDGRANASLREYLARFPLGRHAGEAQRLLARPGSGPR